MGKINVLSKDVAEKIAAGEVVERPASIVKELAENSFDADASSVTVEIERGGISYIRVTDNGGGIEPDDVKKAFLRHATSKISSAEDLNKILTLGFRGEALASIGAVSRTELITKTVSGAIGTGIEVEGGSVVRFGEAGCPRGTTVTVKNLFYNTPARMKFLKKDSVEAGYVTDVCQRAALSRPEVSFRFIKDGRDIFFTPGDNVLKNTVRAIFGKDISSSMTELEKSFGNFKVTGLIGKNNLSRPNRAMQYFFVNGRLVKSALLSLALSEGYKNELMIGRFPVCVLNIELPPDEVDVNVHPAKTEVKFSREDEVYRNLSLAVRGALTGVAAPREASFGINSAYKMPTESKKAPQEFFREVKVSPPAAEKKPLFKKEERIKTAPAQPFDEKRAVKSIAELPKRATESLVLREPNFEPAPEHDDARPLRTQEPKPRETAEIPEAPEKKELSFKVVGQVFSTYIILETDSSMIMIDQHAAHERLNYEAIKSGKAMHQTLLMPITASLSPTEKAAWEQECEFLRTLGFETEDFGEGRVIIRTLPADIDFEDGEALFLEIIDTLTGAEKGRIMKSRDYAVYTVACKAAIKANHTLSMAEMESLARRALSMEGITTCPHGRPISVEISKYRLEKMFKRIV